MLSTSEKVYMSVLEYCKRKGLINNLKKWFKKSETELFYNKNIKNKGLNIIDAVHCLFDKKRSLFFLNELDSLVKENDIVYEAGVGTGLLSFLAATKGAEVWGVEISKETYNLAKNIKSYLEKKKIIPKDKVNFILGNAVSFKLHKKADVVISENIYTGMFYEKQAQIINNSLNFLKNKGCVVPSSVQSYLYLAEAEFPHPVKHKDEVVPSPDKNFYIKSKKLSNKIKYDKADFTKTLPVNSKKFSFVIPLINKGYINSLVIYSEVTLPSGLIIKRFDTSFLNGDIFIAINPPIKVKKGDIASLNIIYKYGCNPKDIQLSLNILK